MKQEKYYKALFLILNSWIAPYLLSTFCVISFIAAQIVGDMNLFASSGAIMSIFGLISMIKYTTVKKLLNQEQEVNSRKGITGPPLTNEQYKTLAASNLKIARENVAKELKSELKGIWLSIVGTLIWAYGAYIPVFLSI